MDLTNDNHPEGVQDQNPRTLDVPGPDVEDPGRMSPVHRTSPMLSAVPIGPQSPITGESPPAAAPELLANPETIDLTEDSHSPSNLSTHIYDYQERPENAEILEIDRLAWDEVNTANQPQYSDGRDRHVEYSGSLTVTAMDDVTNYGDSNAEFIDRDTKHTDEEEVNLGTKNKAKTVVPKSGFAKSARDFWYLKVQEIKTRLKIEEENIWGIIMPIEDTRMRFQYLKSQEETGKLQGDKHKAEELDDARRFIGGSSFERGFIGADEMEPIEMSGEKKQARLRSIWKNMEGARKEIARLNGKELDLMTKSFGMKKCSIKDSKVCKLEGLELPLRHHQVVGTGLMVAMETCSEYLPDRPAGGILADEMGLGKTVQTLATIIHNPPTDDEFEDNRSCTLIVCPSSVKEQWRNECDKFTPKLVAARGFPKTSTLRGGVYMYEGKSQTRVMELETRVAVICSYADIMNCIPSDAIMEENGLETFGAVPLDKARDGEWAYKMRQLAGPLLQAEWYRVVLDEGHVIKKTGGKTMRACCSLISKYKWILSGTPAPNSLEEFFPHFMFIGMPGSDSTTTFHATYPTQTDLLNAIHAVTIRRLQAEVYLGSPVLDLPKPETPSSNFVDFSHVQEMLYRHVDAVFIERYCEMAGVDHPTIQTYNIKLLRLRQLCSHPFHIEPVIRSMLELEDMEYFLHHLKEINANGGNASIFVEAIEKIMRQREIDERKAQIIQAVNDNMSAREARIMQMNHRKVDLDTDLGIFRCNMCQADSITTTEMAFTECSHVYCKTCFYDCAAAYADRMLEEPEEVEGIPKTFCPECNKAVRGTIEESRWNEKDFPNGAPKRTTRKSSRKHRGVGDDSRCSQPPAFSKSIFIQVMDKHIGKGKPVLRGAKIDHMMKMIENALHKAPDDKSIVFSQFNPTLAVVGRALQEANIGFLYFTGEVSKAVRQSVIAMFKSRPDIKVLVMGLKCGGVGLNLTMANRVYNLDPWWNTAMESQAFSRVLRLGQTKTVYRHKFLAAGTIEVRMLLLQKDKANEVEEATRDKQKFSATLNKNQLVQLFPEEENIKGNPRVQDVSEMDNTYFVRTMAKRRRLR